MRSIFKVRHLDNREGRRRNLNQDLRKGLGKMSPMILVPFQLSRYQAAKAYRPPVRYPALSRFVSLRHGASAVVVAPRFSPLFFFSPLGKHSSGGAQTFPSQTSVSMASVTHPTRAFPCPSSSSPLVFFVLILISSEIVTRPPELRTLRAKRSRLWRENGSSFYRLGQKLEHTLWFLSGLSRNRTKGGKLLPSPHAFFGGPAANIPCIPAGKDGGKCFPTGPT